MRIAINGRFLAKPHTGIGVYTRRLFSALALQNPDSELVMFTPETLDEQGVAGASATAGNEPAPAFPPNIRIVAVPEKFPASAGLKKAYWEQVRLPAAMAKYQPDVAHFPYPSNPWRGGIGGRNSARLSPFKAGKTPGKPPCPVVVTVHDVIPWTVPAYRRKISTRLYQERCRRAVGKADRVITVSNASESEIARVCGVPKAKIEVIPNAPAPAFFKKFTPEESAPILKKYGIDPQRPYFLYAGGYDPRKNVSLLAKTWASKIAPRYNTDLVLAGGKSHESAYYSSYDLTELNLRHSLQSSKGKIIFTGFVKDEDFPVLYQFCRAFLNLSRAEGFNLPLLEAGVSGVPAIASDIPVHREVAGSYAEFCPPDDIGKLADIMEKLIIDKPYLQAKKKSAEKYKCPYSWEHSAKQLMRTYKNLL